MESLVENEQLPGTSPPPVSTSMYDVANEKPPPYSPSLPNQPVHTSTFGNSFPQEENQPPVMVRTVQYEERDPPGLTRTIIYSLVFAMLSFICIVPMICAIPAVIFSIMALSKRYDVSKRESYANTAWALTRASYVIIGMLFVLGFVLRLTTGYYN